ncbi:MAG: hypothetical protein AAF202_08590 [Pseudomonadota bacterium]
MLQTVNDRFSTFEYMAYPTPMTPMPTRSVVFQQSDGKLFIISPGPFDEETFKTLEAKSNEIILVSPNMFHHMHIEKSFERWPNVGIYGQPALWKLKKQPWIKPYLKDIKEIHTVLSTELKAMFVRGVPALSETVFYDTKTKTLVITDLCFNMDNTVSFTTQFLLRAFGAYNKTAQSKLVRMNVKDKSAYKSSMENILQLDFDQVLISHGNHINDPDAFRSAIEKTF